MAKSKKALKALKRRNQAKERSRALKMRQDYTVGGRVKAQQGGFPSALPEGVRNAVEEARKAAEEQEKEAQEAQQAQVQPTPTPPMQQPVTPTPTVTPEPVTQQIQEAVTPTVPTQPTTPVQQQPIQQQPITAAIPDQPNFGTRYDGKPYTANDYNLIKGQGGDPNNDGVITDEEWTNWMLGKGPTPGFEEDYERKLREVAAQGDLKRSTIQAINNKIEIVKQPDPTETERTTIQPERKIGAPDFSGSYEDFAGKPPTEADFGATPYFRGTRTPAQIAFQNALNEYNSKRDLWNRLDVQSRLTTFDPDEYGYGETGGGAGSGSQGEKKGTDPAQDVLDQIFDKAEREKAKVDAPEAFTTVDVQKGDQFEVQDDAVEQLDTIEDVGQRTITRTDAVPETATLTTAETQPDITRNALETYSNIEASYLDRYPEAKAAIEAGTFNNVFDYHLRQGAGEGNTLDIDTTKISKSDFSRIASADKAEIESATAALRDTTAEQAALGTAPTLTRSPGSVIEAVEGPDTVQLSPTVSAERQTRQAITDEVAAQGTEAIIQGSLGYDAAERRQVKGEAAQGAARSMLTEVGELPDDITKVILDNPAQITAQVDVEPVEVQAAIAALPQEALVSAQLENLLAGIDEGITPTWARPAVQLVESRLNARGLNVSTVARDALFNAIIQTAIPIAQSNATALQQRATQNLSNEQQANLQQSSQEMQLRLNNLANRQTSEAQSAQLAQQINLAQGEISQQTALTESQQNQQVRLQSLQNEQQAAMANLGNDQQIELANLQIEAQRLGANQSAVNQERLAEMQVAANFLEKNAAFKQQMELANLSSEQQMRLAFLSAKNQAEAQNLTTAQQTELANLSKNLEVNKINAQLAQQLGLAQLSVDQQVAIRNASTVANMDLTAFSAEQQIELANSKFMQTSTLQDFSQRQQVIMQEATALASSSLAEADAITRVSIENAKNFLQKDLAELSIEQQAYMLDSQQRQQRLLTSTAAENAARQFNSSSDLQTEQFIAQLGQQIELQNTTQANAMAQFNATEANRIEALNAGNEIEAQKFENQLNAQIDQFNTQVDFQRDQWNSQNAQIVEQSNVDWRRKVNMAETATQNAANQLQAQQLFQLTQTEQAFLWQQLRDEANYYRQQYENEEQRKTTLYATALANESDNATNQTTSRFASIEDMFNKPKVGAAETRFDAGTV